MSEAVQKMFANIAWRYDLANDILSFGIHRLWRKWAVRSLNLRENARVLDLCTGTGDVAFEIASQSKSGTSITGMDFVPEMLELARKKVSSQNIPSGVDLRFIEGDAMNVGLPEKSLDGVTISFGIRNVDDPLVCLTQLQRTLKPGGRLAILEFGQPQNKLFATVYWTYAKYILPRIGALITGNRAAYEYLPRTSQSFPSDKKFTALLKEAGFHDEHYRPLFGGIAYLYTASA